MNRYDQIIDQLLQVYTSKDFSADVTEGKNNFFEGTGFLDEESEGFEMKMMQFGDWYVFNRPLLKTGRPPIVDCLDSKLFDFTEEEVKAIKNMQAARHSLFEFIKFSNDDMHIKDVFSNYKMVLKSTPLKFGFNKGDLFEARLIPHEDSFCFTRSFSFHPAEAKKYLLKKVKQIQAMPVEELSSAREKFILKAYKMKNRYEQYAHVAAEKIYTDSVGPRV